MTALAACVVVPARDEEALIGACLDALAAQRGVAREAWEVIVVLDACSDDTEGEVRRAMARAARSRAVEGFTYDHLAERLATALAAASSPPTGADAPGRTAHDPAPAEGADEGGHR